ncbi:MAG: AmmeMemoRadiSam system protein A [Gammaproteobacteria bacterium]
MPLSLCIDLSADEQACLLDIARQSIMNGLDTGAALQLDIARLDANLRIDSAVFVTLTLGGNLRGCIGSLQPSAPLAQAVANAAFNAAFRDPRFAQVQVDEVENLTIEVSVLSSMELIAVDTRQALLDNLQPGVDGLLLEDQGHRATFLPQVWEKMSTADEFVGQLMLKAGLAAGYWSSTIRCYRYHSISFGEN